MSTKVGKAPLGGEDPVKVGEAPQSGQSPTKVGKVPKHTTAFCIKQLYCYCRITFGMFLQKNHPNYPFRMGYRLNTMLNLQKSPISSARP